MNKQLHFLLLLTLWALLPAQSTKAVVFEATHYTTYNGLAANTVRYIMQDAEGYMWLSTINGLSRFDGYSFKYYGKAEGLTEPRLFYTQEDANGDILIFSVSEEGFRLDKQRDTVVALDDSTEVPYIERIPRNLPDEERAWVNELMRDNHIIGRYFCVLDKQGNTWFAAYGHGLWILNHPTGEVQHYSYAGGDTRVLSSDNIMALAQDRSGCIWIGYEFYGFTMLRTLDNSWYEYHHFGQLNDDNFRLLFSDNGSLLTGNRACQIRHFLGDEISSQVENGLQFGSVPYSAMRDSKGTLYVGTRGSGLYVNGHNYLHDDADSTSIASDHVYAIREDDKGRIWVGAFEGGLDVIEQPGAPKLAFRHFFQETYGTRRARGIRKDINGWLWVGTSDGLLVFHPDSLLQDKKNYYSLNIAGGGLISNEIRSLFIASDNQVYIAEDGEGFAVVAVPEDANYSHLKATHYKIESGLTNNMVQAFSEDRHGKIWISTELGINSFEPQTGRIVGYYPGLTMHSNVFNEDAAVTLADGRIAFGSTSGLLVIDPALTPKTATKSQIKMVGMDTDENGALHAAFSTFSYNSRTPDLYSFRLSGYDKEWTTPTADNSIDYRNIQPGKHVLHVRVLAEDGRWSEDATFAFTIPVKWYRSWWWATILALVLLTILAYTVYSLYTRSQLHEQMELTEKLNEAKLVFFTNVSHEFRTPLTLIRGAIDRISNMEGLPQQLNPQIKMLERNSDRLMRLINQLLEFRRMQNKVMSLRLEKLDIVLQLRELFASFKDLAESKNIHFAFQSDTDALMAYVDRSNLDKVLYNLLSNAIKYTPDGGSITLSVKTYQDPQEKLIIQVIDTGVGVPDEQRASLFDQRFTRSRFLNGTGSIGIGLNLTAALVEVHHGKITYEPNQPNGSIFTVSLPLSLESYSDEDFIQEPDNPLRSQADQLQDVAVPELIVPINSQTILLVDDNDDMRTYVAEELSHYFLVDTAPSGEKAVEMLAEKEYALVVTDVMMQGMSGFDLARHIKSDFSTSHIPVVALTALDSTEKKIEGTESGVDAYVTKPFSPKLLLATIINLINSRVRMRERFSKDLSSIEPIVTDNSKDKEFLDKFNQLIQDELQNSDIQADDFAAKMLLGRTVFFKKVKGLTGYSPKEYLRIQRMKKAVELFRSGEYNVSEVTYEVGMTDPFYFSRCFKQQFGIPPTTFIKQLRGENPTENDDPNAQNDAQNDAQTP